MSVIDHPGLVLARDLERLSVSPTELARQLKVPANRFSQIINGKRAITGDTALRLAHWFGNAPDYWLHLQSQYDLHVAALEAGTEIESLPTRLKIRARAVVVQKTISQRANHGAK